MSKWRFALSLLVRRLWLHAALFSAAAVGAVLVAAAVQPFIHLGAPYQHGSRALEGLLAVIASSMLAVATFSLGMLVNALGRIAALSPDKTRKTTGNWSGRRESNPHEKLGKLSGYHYITPAQRPDHSPAASPGSRDPQRRSARIPRSASLAWRLSGPARWPAPTATKLTPDPFMRASRASAQAVFRSLIRTL